jgi:hypothetical protein
MTAQTKAIFKYYFTREGEGYKEDYNLGEAAKAMEEMTFTELLEVLKEVKK